jgi:hypothetical protein
MVVRYEVDAAYPSTSTAAAKLEPTGDVDDLAVLLSGASLTNTAGKTIAGLSIVRAGATVPQDNILELTTRSTRNVLNFDWAEALPQLLLSRTPSHILGVHERGTFDELRKSSLGSAALRAAEAQAQSGLQGLRSVLETIQDTLLENAVGKKVSLVCKSGKLKVYERVGKGLLPEEAMARFDS